MNAPDLMHPAASVYAMLRQMYLGSHINMML